MKEIAIPEILCGVCDKLHQRKIRKTNGYEFTPSDMSKDIRFFEQEESVLSVTHEAWIQLDGHVYDGYITIWRDGFLQVSLAHRREV